METSGFYQLVPKKKSVKVLFNQYHDKCLVFRHSHIAITDYHMGDKPEFEKCLSVWDEMQWKYRRMAGYYVKELKEFRLPRGFDLELLSQHFKGYKVVVDNNDAIDADTIETKLMTPPKDDAQRMIITFLCNQGEFKKNNRYTSHMIDAQTGFGKAQPDDTPIPTPDGWRKLGDLQVGDYVFNVDGEPVKVIGVYPQNGKRETYRVTFKDGRTTDCNPDHLWTVKLPGRKHTMTITTEDMLEDFERPFITQDGVLHHEHKYAVPLCGPVQYPHRDTSVDPWVFGALIGNGCLTHSRLTISSGNMWVPKEMSRILGYPTEVRSSINYNYGFIVGKTYDHDGFERRIRLQTKDVLKDFPDFIGAKSGDKYIPEEYMLNDVRTRYAILQGLMDTDGYIDDNKFRISYTTVSRRLANDIATLVRSLGYMAIVHKDPRGYEKYTTGECFHIHMICPDSDKPLFFRANLRSLSKAKRAAANYKSRRKEGFMNIMKIERVEDTHQRCIKVDDPRHLYVTENFIVTHNTYCTVAGSCFMRARTIVISPIGKLLDQWKESYLKFTDLKEDEVLTVQGSKKCLKILDGDYPDVKVFIFSLDTIVSFAKTYGNLMCMDMLEKTRAYLKVFDECHLDMKGVNLIEALCNTKHTIYASASPGRSAKKENWIFRNLYRHVPRFGSKLVAQDEKYLDIMIVPYRWLPTPAQAKRIINARTKWLNSNLYEKELFLDKTQNGDFFGKLETMLKWSKKIVKPENKILIMCGTVEGTQTIMDLAETIFPGECSRYYGGMKDAEKKRALDQRIICATGQSLGTGADIKGIQHVYNVSTYSNWINANQKPGRARKLDDDTQVIYIELVNFGYMKTVRQYEKRRPELIKKTRSGQLMLIQ